MTNTPSLRSSVPVTVAVLVGCLLRGILPRLAAGRQHAGGKGSDVGTARVECAGGVGLTPMSSYPVCDPALRRPASSARPPR